MAASDSQHIIDCSVSPFIPDGNWILEEDQLKSHYTGKLVWMPEDIRLHVDPTQETDETLGEEIRKKLEGRPVLTANVLDHLLDHPALIPRTWMGWHVFFWGTIYRYAVDRCSVRYLLMADNGLSTGSCWTGQPWRKYLAAAERVR